jgi:hypothetical protein
MAGPRPADCSLALGACDPGLGQSRCIWQQLPSGPLLVPLRAVSSAHLRRLGYPKKMLTLTLRAFVEEAHSLPHAYLIQIGQNSTAFSISRA